MKKDSKSFFKPTVFPLSRVPLNLSGRDICWIYNVIKLRSEGRMGMYGYNLTRKHTHTHTPPLLTANPGY